MKQKTFILFFLFFVGCTNFNRTNCNKGSQSYCQSSDSIASEIEIFSDFIEKFHSDTLFQQHRLSETVTGYNSDNDTFLENDGNDYVIDYPWDVQELLIYLQWINEDKTKSEYKTSIISVSDSIIIEKIYIPQSSNFYDLKFSILKGKWFLINLIVNNM